jgi:hypothetical protein
MLASSDCAPGRTSEPLALLPGTGHDFSGHLSLLLGRRSLAKASSVLLGPGTYWLHPPAALPKPRVDQHSRHFQHRPCPPYGQSRERDRAYTCTLHEVGDLPARCPQAIALTYAQHARCKCRQYFDSAAAKLAPPHEPGHASGSRPSTTVVTNAEGWYLGSRLTEGGRNHATDG